MATDKQKLGAFGETVVAKRCSCPRCKGNHTLRRLPTNFKCADVICDFCGFLAQVKSVSTTQLDNIPKIVAGAAWGPQKSRMDAGIYFPLYLVLVDGRKHSVYYLGADYQLPEMFKKRAPLSASAKRAGWQGFLYDLSVLPMGSIVRLL